MHATRNRCCSAIFDVIMMTGSFWQLRRCAGSKKGFDHVGDNGAGLDEVECRDGRIHSVELLAAAQELGVDRTDLVERLAYVAVVVEVLGDFAERVVRHVVHLRTLTGRADGQIALGAVAAIVGAVAARPSAALVLLEQRAAQEACERRQAAQELVAALAQRRGGSVLHEWRIPLITGPMILVVFDSWVKPFLSSAEGFHNRREVGEAEGIDLQRWESWRRARHGPIGPILADGERSTSQRPKLF